MAINYTSLQSIREEAGLQRQISGGEVTGTVNGVNTVFTVPELPIVDNNYDGSVNASDVIVYVNGVVVTVSSVNAAAGTVTLAVAPAVSAVVTIDYATSNLSDTYVQERQDDAQDWIDTLLSGFSYIPYTVAADVPNIISNIARLYAGGLILVRDYGSSADTDLSSKDGYQKIKLAREFLNDFKLSYEGASDSSGINGLVKVTTDNEVFQRSKYTSDTATSRDDAFMRFPAQFEDF